MHGKRSGTRVKSDDFGYVELVRRALKVSMELKARVLGKRFYCNALTGTSRYNICVNSDMSLSCNCQDYKGFGRLGSLDTGSLKEIFEGPVASRFRDSLASGKLPITTCTRCPEIRWVDKGGAGRYRYEYDLPRKGIMVENTVHCNLDCLGCERDTVMQGRSKKSMSLDDIRKISAMIRENAIETIFYFNLGEPFFSKHIHEELKIIKGASRKLALCISTNGVLLDNDDKREASLLVNLLLVSLDGPSNEIVTKYQRKGNFDKAYANMKAMVEYRNRRSLRRPKVEWKYVLFNWNDKREMILKAIRLAREAGIDVISFWPTMAPIRGISWRYHAGFFLPRLKQVTRGKRKKSAHVSRIRFDMSPIRIHLNRWEEIARDVGVEVPSLSGHRQDPSRSSP
jgi:molybdenum cofactor biosynthesis enzyme MoaA